jgi:hypothetical protein
MLKVRLYQSINSPGINPSNTFLLLATLLDREFKNGNASKAFVSFVQEPHPQGLGMKPDDLLTIVSDLRHPHEESDEKLGKRMEAMRNRVRQLVLQEVPEISENGTNQHSGIGITKPSDGGMTATYILRRLKRARPDLAKKVVDGELSANAAAIKAGIRRKPTRFEQIMQWLPKLSAHERASLAAACSQVTPETGARRPDPSEDCATVDHADNEVKPCR